MSLPGRRWRVLVNVLVSLTLLTFLASRVDVRETTKLMLAADQRTLVVAAALFLGSHLLGALQWGKLLRAGGLRLRSRRVLAYYFQGAFFGLFLPANVGADVSRVVDTTRETGKLGGSIAATVMDRLVGLTSIGLMAVVALFIDSNDPPPLPILVPTLGFAGVNLLVCLALFSRRASRFLTRQAERIPQPGLRDTLVRSIAGLHALGRKPGLVGSVLLVSMCVQVLRIAVHMTVAVAMGIHLPARTFFVVVPVLAVLVALPVSFGGIGVREAAAAHLFGHFGLEPARAIGMQVLAFLVSIVVSLPGWFVFAARQLRGRQPVEPVGVAHDDR